MEVQSLLQSCNRQILYLRSVADSHGRHVDEFMSAKDAALQKKAKIMFLHKEMAGQLDVLDKIVRCMSCDFAESFDEFAPRLAELKEWNLSFHKLQDYMKSMDIPKDLISMSNSDGVTLKDFINFELAKRLQNELYSILENWQVTIQSFEEIVKFWESKSLEYSAAFSSFPLDEICELERRFVELSAKKTSARNAITVRLDICMGKSEELSTCQKVNRNSLTEFHDEIKKLEELINEFPSEIPKIDFASSWTLLNQLQNTLSQHNNDFLRLQTWISEIKSELGRCKEHFIIQFDDFKKIQTAMNSMVQSFEKVELEKQRRRESQEILEKMISNFQLQVDEWVSSNILTNPSDEEVEREKLKRENEEHLPEAFHQFLTAPASNVKIEFK